MKEARFPNDATTPRLLDVAALEAALQTFADQRDWNRHHLPRSLVLALTGEVGELAELFQWLSDADAARIADDPERGRAVRDELADVLLYLVRLASVLKIDLNEAVVSKIAANARKYPVP